jgi:hypothetical protein
MGQFDVGAVVTVVKRKTTETMEGGRGGSQNIYVVGVLRFAFCVVAIGSHMAQG